MRPARAAGADLQQQPTQAQPTGALRPPPLPPPRPPPATAMDDASLDRRLFTFSLLLHGAAQMTILINWSSLPPSERAQRLGSVAWLAVFPLLAACAPRLYLRHRTAVLSVQRIVFFVFPLLRQPRGEWRIPTAWCEQGRTGCRACVQPPGCPSRPSPSTLHSINVPCPTPSHGPAAAGIQSVLDSEPQPGLRGALKDMLRIIWVRSRVQAAAAPPAVADGPCGACRSAGGALGASATAAPSPPPASCAVLHGTLTRLRALPGPLLPACRAPACSPCS